MRNRRTVKEHRREAVGSFRCASFDRRYATADREFNATRECSATSREFNADRDRIRDNHRAVYRSGYRRHLDGAGEQNADRTDIRAEYFVDRHHRYYYRHMKKLGRKFFERNTLAVARGLIGRALVRKWRSKEILATIIETEAYHGPHDRASHASRGVTPRTEVMFGEAGHAYVYLIYGMHHCFNIVTGHTGYPAAVLIRGVSDKATGKIISGPGRVAKFLHLNRSLNKLDLCKNDKLWMERGEKISSRFIKTGKRIGVDYAGEWKDKLWRFYLKNILK